ncbi:glutamate 5-kinase [Solicola gregarius]|uniref:Glutamate 5-kinase n=1 Tax=Solicola gregarius TaxID=2908642 RepID=A0AA46TGB4_9ACTN|nr:glutamate 5-kinase [Solicola gregarius]UYM04324.1 glutamate 5-kinase [Solicola gregarius]
MRIVVKVGSSSLSTAGDGIDTARVSALVNALAEARSRGDEVVLVSSGAIASGIAPLGLGQRPRDLAAQQAAASVGQGLLVAHYTERFARHGYVVGQVLLTLDDVTRRSHYRNAYRTFAKLLELGVVPIVNENDTVATSEIRFGDNDRLAALVAHLVHADLLVLLSDVNALYDGDPRSADATPITDVRGEEDLARVELRRPSGSRIGTGGMVTKVEAARIATGAGVPVVLTDVTHAAEALTGGGAGTRFHPTGRRRPTRLLWLAHATEGKGRITVDAGAVRALRDRGASLLPAGIVAVDGDFVAGDPVDLVATEGGFEGPQGGLERPGGSVVARGIVSYDSAEIPRLIGRSTRELAAELGPEYEREVMHRDDLVLLDEPAQGRR